jgi:SAM-dependent methyltransferase
MTTQLKATQSMARTGRPWSDNKPPPATAVWEAIEGCGRYHVLLAALELGLFDTVGQLGPCTSETAAARLGVSAPHLGVLLDAVVALGLLDQCRGRYELNDVARRYLTSDSRASMAGLVPVAPGPLRNWSRLADTVRKGRPAAPIDDDPEAFYVALVEGTFATTWRCATSADSRIRYSALPAARILELGAGGAPWSIAVLAACPQGQALVNDLPRVLAVAGNNLADHGVAGRAELRPGDYHQIPIEAGDYDLAVLGHVCRAEEPAGARHLIERAFTALRPGGRVVIADYFCDPGHKKDQHAVMMAATMIASTAHGSAYTADEVGDWLRGAGFGALRLVEPIRHQQCIVATRPERMRARC